MPRSVFYSDEPEQGAWAGLRNCVLYKYSTGDKFMAQCRFCSKECKSTQSLAQHQSRCKENTNRVDPSSWATGNRKGIPSWNAGLHGDVRCKLSDSTKAKLSVSTSNRNKNESDDTKQKRRDTINKKVQEGTWHTSLAERLHYRYKGFDLHGTWELAYAKFLDSVDTPWCKNSRTFEYEFEGKKRRYTPDFYLPLEDVYVEIKGYKTEKDMAKWSQFPETLAVLMELELRNMKLI